MPAWEIWGNSCSVSCALLSTYFFGTQYRTVGTYAVPYARTTWHLQFGMQITTYMFCKYIIIYIYTYGCIVYIYTY